MGAPEILGWSLIHFVWQGCLIGGLAWAALRLLRGASPEARYAVACLGLAAMLAAPVATGLVLRRAAPAAAPAAPARPAVVLPARVVAAAAGPAAPTLQERIRPALPWILGLWAAGVLLLSLRLAGGWLWMQRLRHGRATRAAEEWQVLVRVLARRLGLAREVLLLACDRIESPVALGWLRPVILIPPALLTGLDPLGLEAVLLHELAHIRRQDYLVNLLQSFAETLLFYHPAVWWLSAAIRQERENACDDTAIRLTGDAVAYARTLSLLEEFRMDTRIKLHATPAPAATGGSLLARVRRILAPAPSAAPLAPRAAVLGLLAAGLLGAATAAPRTADEPQADKKEEKKVVMVRVHEDEGAGDVAVRIMLKGGTKVEDLRKDLSLMAPGSSVKVSEKGKAYTAERAKDGAYKETYEVDGKAEAVTPEVRAWAQGRLPDPAKGGGEARKVVVAGPHKVVVETEDHKGAPGGGEHTVIIRKKVGDGGKGGEEKKIVIKRLGSDPDLDMDFDFDIKHGDFKWTPEHKAEMEKLHKELKGKKIVEIEEIHKKLSPEMRAELEKHHKSGKTRTFTFRSADGDVIVAGGPGKEMGQKARLQALKGLADSLAKDAEDADTKAALARIRAEIEGLEAKAKK